MKDNKIFCFSIFLIISFYFFNSILLSRNYYTSVNNHMFMVFQEASKFLDGKLLYKEVFARYGVAEPILNAGALYVFGDNIFSIYIIVNLLYFLGIFLICLICLKINFSKIQTFFILLVIINIYPAPVSNVPFSMHHAFFFCCASLYFLLGKNKYCYLFSGFLLAVACLLRETIILSSIAIFIFLAFYFFFIKRKNFNIFKLYTIGFCFPLIIFFAYMIFSKNYLFWIEIILPANRIDTINYLAHYYSSDLTILKKLYIFFLVPFREIFLVFSKSILNFWFNWILIFLSYICCLALVIKSLIKINNFKNENELYIISVYAISLIIQNLHNVAIFRVSTGSIIGILTLGYYIQNLFKGKKSIIAMISILIILFNNQYATFPYAFSTKNFFKESIENIKQNFNSLGFVKNYEQIPQFKNMNYGESIHKFYIDFQEACVQLVSKKGVKYSYNDTDFWELAYFCKTKPKYYFPFTYSNWTGVSRRLSNFDNVFKEAKSVHKYYYFNNPPTYSNTIEFHVSNSISLEHKMISIKDNKVANSYSINNTNKDDYEIIYVVDLIDSEIKLNDNKRYFLIIQKKYN